jgi:N-acetylglutamate synthase/N-acetylornithine aminotransferase
LCQFLHRPTGSGGGAANGAVAAARIANVPIRIAGICKGSGMLAPDMATMLAFVCRDAALSPAVLRALLAPAVMGSLNTVTVDGDRSANDCWPDFATGQAGGPGSTIPAIGGWASSNRRSQACCSIFPIAW